MAHVFSWLSQSGVVQGAIIGATLACLTAILILDVVARSITTTVNGWSSIRDCGQPGNGTLVRAACCESALRGLPGAAILDGSYRVPPVARAD